MSTGRRGAESSTAFAYPRPTPELDHWRGGAECLGADPAWFDLTGQILTRENLIALRYCDRCPVVAECRAAALLEGNRGTIRGGVADPDLLALRRLGAKAAA